MKKPIRLELTWGEAANLLVAAGTAETGHFTPAARGNLRRAIEKLAAAVPMDDPNAFFLIVRGQTPDAPPGPRPLPQQLAAELEPTPAGETASSRRARQPRSPRSFRRKP